MIFHYITKHAKGKITEIEELSIDIKFKNWQKIKYFREKALIDKGIDNQPKEEVPAKIRYNNKTYRADISITGQMNAHIIHPYKWSFMVKLKDGETIKGVNKFALLFPQARGYLTDWIALELLKSQNLIGIKTDFVDINLNGKNFGLYYFEERFGQNLLVNNERKEGVIFKLDGDLKIYEPNKIAKNKVLSTQLERLEKLLHLFLTDKISVGEIFDIEKFATLFVVSDIMNNTHALFRGNSRLYFNSITNLIEPIGREWDYLRRITLTPNWMSIEKPNPDILYHENLHKDPILSKFINSDEFIEAYVKKANILSNPTYVDSIISLKNTEFELLLNKIYKQNPFYIFPLGALHKNQEYMRNKLYPYPASPRVDVFFNKIKNDSLFLYIENKIDLPIEVQYLTYNKKKIENKKTLLKPNYRNNYKKQEISFVLNKDIDRTQFSADSLEVYYNLLGLENIEKAIVFPKVMTEQDYLELTSTKQPANVDDFDFLAINNVDKIIEFPSKNCEVNKDLIVPEGYSVTAKPGCKINLTNSAKIISYSPILFFGTSDNPITITSSDSTGQGIVVFNTDRVSEFSYVNFKSLSNVSNAGWLLDGAITFYESPLNINNCNFSDNLRSANYLNILRTNFNILNSTFENTNADAFCSEFSTGAIENVTFNQIGKDAISSIGSKLHIEEVKILNLKGNGINGAQNSQLICENITIKGGKISILSKDNTSIEINQITINSSELAYCAFQDKSGYGPAAITLENSTTHNVQKDFLIEVGSSLTLNGATINMKSEKVKEILYDTKNTK